MYLYALEQYLVDYMLQDLVCVVTGDSPFSIFYNWASADGHNTDNVSYCFQWILHTIYMVMSLRFYYYYYCYYYYYYYK